ncbi:hypothetical protein BD779DRAFT_1673587 [Infundibulicybe gibba]|nr:hypothetical protein BD779DRAFT_1673587 [Infundibulicybe gibba]
MLADLPPELVREILLHATQTSTSSCRTLCEVSTWVRKLALPILYTTVFLDHFTIEVFAHVVASSSLVCPPSPIFRPADAVRHICVSPTVFVPLCTIIRHCKNATHFAFNRIGISALSSAMDPSVSISREEACLQGGDREEVEGALHVTLLNNGSHAGWELFNEDTMFRPHKPLSRRLRRVRFGRPIVLGYSLSIPHLPGLTHLAAPAMGVTENELNNIFDIFTGTSIESLYWY